jgi:hypothetical protein
MNLLDDVGTGEDKVVVAALFAAEVLSGEVVVLDGRSHGAVEDENAPTKGVEIGGTSLLGHRKGSEYKEPPALCGGQLKDIVNCLQVYPAIGSHYNGVST